MSKGYRRVELTTDDAQKRSTSRRGTINPLRIALALAGAALLVASGVQLVELMNAMPRPEASAAALATPLPRPDVAWTTIAGSVLMPLAAVLCFVAFSAVRRTHALRP